MIDPTGLPYTRVAVIDAPTGADAPYTRVALIDAATGQPAGTGYSTGTWTPDLKFGGVNTGITYATQAGSYVQIGKLIFAQFRIALTSKGSATGNVNLGGVPLSATTAGTLVGTGARGTFAAMAGITDFTIALGSNSTLLFFPVPGAAGHSFLTDANFTNTTNLAGSITYVAA